MEKEQIFTIGIMITFLLLFFGVICYLLIFHNNINEIVGIKCARTSRITVDYPFCSHLLDCMEDCSTVKAGFVEVKTVSGFANKNRCFCYTTDGIRNIW